MNRASQFFLSLVLIAGTIWIIIKLFEMVTDLTQAGVSQGSVAIVSGALTIITLAVTRSLDRRQEHERALREKKAELYHGFMEKLVGIFYSDESKSTEEKTKELTEFVKDFVPKFILWGSNDSVKAFSKFMVRVRTDSADATENLRAMAQLFLSLRSEFGHRTVTLPPDDLLRILVTDWDDHLSKKQNTTT